MKFSRQRELILETLRNCSVHPTAEEIYVKAKREMASISLGTVYRNLNLLTEMGKIRKLESAGNTSVRYDGRNDEHCHLVCTSCGTITDVDLKMFSHIDKIVEQKTGFSISEHGIVLKGTCAECSAIKN
jgi:Fe2+ or Zn2+ uptake regulation protein